MDCTCQCWKDKELKLNCCKCGGKVCYIKTIKVNDNDEAKLKLAKLKKELHDKKVDITILRMEIRDLELEEDDYKIKSVESGKLPNCLCDSCT